MKLIKQKYHVESLVTMIQVKQVLESNNCLACLALTSRHLWLEEENTRLSLRRLIEIVFNDDTWTIDLLNNSILNNKSEIIFQDKDFNILDTYKYQMLYFIEKISSDQMPMNSFSESINPLKITLNND